MSEATTVDVQAVATPLAVKLPPGPRIPKALQGIGYLVSRRWTVERFSRRHGSVFTMNIPVFGHTVIVADPQLAKQLFTASTEDVGNIQPNLSRMLGAGSVFALDGADHRRRRKLLTPPFHGKSIKNFD
jgi:cytochrome P450 family 138